MRHADRPEREGALSKWYAERVSSPAMRRALVLLALASSLGGSRCAQEAPAPGEGAPPVDEAVDDAGDRAVDRPVWKAVDDAVADALYWAVVDAVHLAVNKADPHPGLERFLMEAEDE